MVSVFAVSSFFSDDLKLIERGENALRSSHVQSFCYDPETEEIRGSVHASMRDKIYTVEVTLEDGQIKKCVCACPKGKTKCHHMAALLLHAAQHVSSTDKPCQWTKAKQPDVAKSVEELFGKKNFTALKRKPTEDDKAWLRCALEPHPFTAMHWLLSSEPVENSTCSVLTFNQIVQLCGLNSVEQKVEFILYKLKLDQAGIDEVSEVTKGQRSNPLWGEYRKGRITSSNFGIVLKAVQKNNIPPSLIKTLKGEYYLEKAKAIQWGICHEDEAIKVYEEVKNVKIKKVGLFLHKPGTIGGSPDGLLDSNTLVEIKCPFSVVNADIIKTIADGKWYLQFVNNLVHAKANHSEDMDVYEFNPGDVRLNLNHPQGTSYFHQIQGLLHITNKENCDFVIWTPKTMLIIPFIRDESWSENLQKILSFYERIFVYSLL